MVLRVPEKTNVTIKALVSNIEESRRDNELLDHVLKIRASTKPTPIFEKLIAEQRHKQQEKDNLLATFLSQKKALKRRKKKLYRGKHLLNSERLRGQYTEVDKRAKQLQADEDEYDEKFHQTLNAMANGFKTDRKQWVDMPDEALQFALEEYTSSVTIFNLSLFEIRRAVKGGCTFFMSIFVDFLPISDGQNLLLGATFKNRHVKFGLVSVYSKLVSTHLVDTLIFEPFRPGLRWDFSLLAPAYDPTGREMNPESMIANPVSESSINLYRKWMNHCVGFHQECPKPSSTFMPTRVVELLHINGRLRLRLRETECEFAEKSPYVALSYCWGQEQHVVTTTQNLRRHLTLINIHDLPLTLRDAVTVIDKLGFQYLWVDSLCIIQDDPNDKELEIAQMPLVYSQATLTLAASRSLAVSRGFLQKRPFLVSHGAEGAVRHKSMVGTRSGNNIFSLLYKYAYAKTRSVLLVPYSWVLENGITEPLDCRAWALQERLLSPHVLEFGTLQTRWICSQTPTSNDLPSNIQERNNMHTREKTDALFKKASTSLLTQTPYTYVKDTIPKSRLLEDWYALVENYTKRYLSLPTDRLPAILGIATRYAKALNEEYCAGLWQGNLHYELLWVSLDPQSQPTCYQGPSWSWAAIQGAVGFRDDKPNSLYLEESFRVVDCRILLPERSKRSPYTDIRFGIVARGDLIVKCPVVSASLGLAEDGKSGHLFYGSKIVLFGTVVLDTLHSVLLPNERMEVSLITLAREKTNRLGIILCKCEDGTYNRLGTFQLSTKNNFAAREMTITII